jgi:hypothetical protein
MKDQQSRDFQAGVGSHLGDPVAAPRMPFAAAFFFGAWYSVVFASSMSLGVRYLHPESPWAHGMLQSFAWALGSGFAIALAQSAVEDASARGRHLFLVYIGIGLDSLPIPVPR